MPRQKGTQIIGTYDGICYYKLRGIYYYRKASSLTRKQFKKSSAFKKSRESSAWFAIASKMASEVYRMMDSHRRQVWMYRDMVQRAVDLFNQRQSEEMVRPVLLKYAGL